MTASAYFCALTILSLPYSVRIASVTGSVKRAATLVFNDFYFAFHADCRVRSMAMKIRAGSDAAEYFTRLELIVY